MARPKDCFRGSGIVDTVGIHALRGLERISVRSGRGETADCRVKWICAVWFTAVDQEPACSPLSVDLTRPANRRSPWLAGRWFDAG